MTLQKGGMAEKFFDKAYGLDSQDKVDQLYNDWADTYDQEVEGYGYASPIRCAEALAKFHHKDQPVLDFGCGTGLSGMALSKVGFETIDGIEISTPMLEKARSLNVYRQLFQGDIDDPFPFPLGTYSAITAVGVISAGAGPADLLDSALDELSPGGLICFSYNGHTLEDQTYVDAIDLAVKSAKAEMVFEEYGDHLPVRGVKSMVYVLKRL